MRLPASETPLFRLLTLAATLSMVLGLQLVAVSGLMGSVLGGQLQTDVLVMLLAMVVLDTGAIISGLTAAMQPDRTRMAAAASSSLLAMLAAATAAYQTGRLPLNTYYLLSMLAQPVVAYGLVHVLTSELKVEGRVAQLPRLAAAGVVAVFGIFGFVAQNWLSLAAAARHMATVRDIMLVAAPLVLLGALAQVKSLKLDPRSWTKSLALRLPAGTNWLVSSKVLLVGCCGAVASVVFQILTAALQHEPDSGISLASSLLIATPLAWLASLYVATRDIRTFSYEQQQGQMAAKMTPSSAKRFLRRYGRDKQNWAATVGLKTTNFIIDHDPTGLLHTSLPASILQIRSEEIQRCVSEVLGQLQLQSKAATHRVVGAIDPETSVRPSIDALKMFACLYLDAGPLVERRIKGLISLLPIVDPGLARLLKPKDIMLLIRRNQWFFHFDFSWIDQHIVQSASSLRYDVRLATLGSAVRQSMLSYLGKTGSAGNLVWLGPEARDRLLQEAPGMANIVEPCPIPSLDGAGGDELLLFIIKFEQLIPRLQRYFNLDSMRSALLDFEPSQESTRIHLVLSWQLKQAKTTADMLQVLKQITSVPWRGFREKDNALQLILATAEALTTAISPQAALSESESPAARDAFATLLAAVKVVGYPSQVLHRAQVSKIELRDIGKLKAVASRPQEARFSEAWLVMATSDYQRFSPESRRELLAFIRGVGEQPALASRRLPQAKSVDALASLARVAGPAEFSDVEATVNATLSWFAQVDAELEIACLLLDAYLFISGQQGRAPVIGAAAMALFSAYIKTNGTELGASHPQMVALMSRWQEILQMHQPALPGPTKATPTAA